MEVKLLLDGDITVVSLSGRIEIEKTQSFKKACLQNFSDRKVVFCMKNLQGNYPVPAGEKSSHFRCQNPV